MPQPVRRLRHWLTLGLLTVVTACGFQLRGAFNLPFATLHVDLPETSELHAVIRRNVEASSSARVVATAKDAEASLRVLGNAQSKQVLSTNSAGQVREYELVRSFSFQLIDRNNQALLPPSQIVLRRDITYSDAQVLSKEAEENLLWRDMQNDLVQQLLRRLATAKLRSE